MPERRSPRRASYRAAQLRARRLAGSLSERGVRGVQTALRDYARRLSRHLLELPRVARAEGALSVRLFREAAATLERDLLRGIVRGRVASYEEVAGIWQRATLGRLRQLGVTDQTLISLVRDPPVTLLGQYENLGAASTWRTLVATGTRNAALEAETIVRLALSQGASPVELARRLRPYVQGSEPFTRAFGRWKDVDLTTLPAGLRGSVGQLKHNSERIAFTETHNARAEAEVTAFAADPFVAAVIWRLAPDRGSQVEPDECDAFAASDLFGLGAGTYPVDSVPLPPHPWDRCERVPLTRGLAEARDPKLMAAQPTGRVVVPRGRGLTPVERDQIQLRVEQNLVQAARAGAGLRQLAAGAVIE